MATTKPGLVLVFDLDQTLIDTEKDFNGIMTSLQDKSLTVEEFIKAYTERELPIPDPEYINNGLTKPERLSFNAIEFPINNQVFQNTEEVKFFYEIYERLMLNSFYSLISFYQFYASKLLILGHKNIFGVIFGPPLFLDKPFFYLFFLKRTSR
jgi:hypothetical protein